MKILVTGGCGYVGSKLVNGLIADNHKIKVVDSQWFGNYLTSNKNLEIFCEDIRDINENHFKDIDTVIHLANIANDPSVELNPNLSWDVNVVQSIKIIELAIKFNVKKFIYASSGSVYGVKEEDEVVEDLSLVPISIYNKTKIAAERIFLSYSDKIKVYNIRPATVCGLSPRMRFDLTVNMFVSQAFNNKQISVNGGNQIRPNIHIDDLVNVYRHFIINNLPVGPYNAGFENLSILEIANIIKKIIPCEIKINNVTDIRSYRLSSKKLLKTGFVKKYNVSSAVQEIYSNFIKGHIQDNDSCHTVLWMKKNSIK